MNAVPRQLAVITGASTGIGLELARLCAQQKFDLIIAADEPLIANAARELSLLGANCTPVECDLASAEGVEKLVSAIAAAARPVAFLDSFSVALSNELIDTGVTVTCLMPGATETDFFERADMMDTKLGSSDKAHPSDVAKTGFDAMMKGELKVVAGFGNKLRAAVAHVAPDSALADINRGMAEPGTGKAEEPKSKRERTDRPRA